MRTDATCARLENSNPRARCGPPLTAASAHRRTQRLCEACAASGNSSSLIPRRSDARTLIAADSDRDAIYLIDIATSTFVRRIELSPSDEPGRLVQDESGTVHVAIVCSQLHSRVRSRQCSRNGVPPEMIGGRTSLRKRIRSGPGSPALLSPPRHHTATDALFTRTRSDPDARTTRSRARPHQPVNTRENPPLHSSRLHHRVRNAQRLETHQV